MFISPGRNIRSKARIRLVLSHSICFAANKRRRSGGRLDDVMSDLCALCTVVRMVKCRESRAAKARKGGVDAFGETSLQSEAALCQTKRNTLPGEGRERRILLSISINLDKTYFDKINKNKNCVYFGKRHDYFGAHFAIAKAGVFLVKYKLPCPKTGRTRLKTVIETN